MFYFKSTSLNPSKGGTYHRIGKFLDKISVKAQI